MKTVAIVGSQWGDEGKGKITDLLAKKSDLVVRFQGGNNAGIQLLLVIKRSFFTLFHLGFCTLHAYL